MYTDAEYHGRNKSYSFEANNEKSYESSHLRENILRTTRPGNDGANFRRYNWTDIERVDSTDLQAKLRDLKPYTQYEILLQAFNQYGRGPVAKIEAFTAGDGNKLLFRIQFIFQINNNYYMIK